MKDAVMKESSVFGGGTVEKKKSKKLDYLIYLLAVVSLALMLVVIFNNNKTSIEVLEPEKTSIASGQKKDETLIKKEDQAQTAAPEDFLKKEESKTADMKKAEAEQALKAEQEALSKAKKEAEEAALKKAQEEALAKKAAEEEKAKAVAAKKEQVKEDEKSSDYNWKVLNRYPAQPDSNLKTVKSYKVKAGDSLWKIAQKHNVRTINLVAVNKMANPDRLFPGQVIFISNM